MSRLKEAICFLFTGHASAPAIRRARVVRSTDRKDGSAAASDYDPRFRLIQFLTWVLSFVLIVCVLGAVIFPAFGREPPAFVAPTISGIIGYFGGAVATYIDSG